MKIRNACRKENQAAITKAMMQGELEPAEDAAYIIVEADRLPSHFLTLRQHGEFVRVAIKDILYFESLQKAVIAHTENETMITLDTLAHLEAVLSEWGFIRVHKSYIVQIEKIKRIRVGFNTKFILIMDNHETVEVSRTFYYRFKEAIGL